MAPQIADTDKVISFRSVLRDSKTDLKSVQMNLDNAFAKLPGIKFFLSSCTATSTKAQNSDDFTFGVSYFIVVQNDKLRNHQEKTDKDDKTI